MISKGKGKSKKEKRDFGIRISDVELRMVKSGKGSHEWSRKVKRCQEWSNKV